VHGFTPRHESARHGVSTARIQIPCSRRAKKICATPSSPLLLQHAPPSSRLGQPTGHDGAVGLRANGSGCFAMRCNTGSGVFSFLKRPRYICTLVELALRLDLHKQGKKCAQSCTTYGAFMGLRMCAYTGHTGGPRYRAQASSLVTTGRRLLTLRRGITTAWCHDPPGRVCAPTAPAHRSRAKKIAERT